MLMVLCGAVSARILRLMIRSQTPFRLPSPRLVPGLGAVLRGSILPAVLTVALAAAAAAAGLDDGVAAYQRGDYAAAQKVFEKEAATGDPRAQYNLGVMYLTGHGVERDAKAAMLWHRRAADQGLAVAQHGLGVLYYRGTGTARDPAAAAAWFRKAADQGLADAQYNLGVMYFNGEGVEENLAEVVKWISLAAGKGFADAQYRLGVMYQDGTGLPRDRNEAVKWFRLAAAGGNRGAAARVRALAARDAADAAVGKADAAGSPAARTTAAPPAPSLEASIQPAAAVAAPPIDPPPKAAGNTGNAGTTPSAHKRVPGSSQIATAGKKPIPEPATAPMGGTTAPSLPAAAIPPAPAGAWRVQLAAYRSAAMAQRAWARVRARHKEALERLSPVFERVDLGAKGVFHRLQAGPVADLAAAATLCQRLRLARQTCLVVAPAKGR